MRLVDWSGSKLRATDDTGSSDPFLKFSIRGSKSTSRYKNWYKRGALMGRATSTDVQYNTLNPEAMRAKRPLYYHGTRSDLENETLRIEVCVAGAPLHQRPRHTHPLPPSTSPHPPHAHAHSRLPLLEHAV